MQNQINQLYTNFEEKFIQVVDSNAAMAKADKNLGNRISAVEKIVLELEQNQETLRKSSENNFENTIEEINKKVKEINEEMTENFLNIESELAEISLGSKQKTFLYSQKFFKP